MPVLSQAATQISVKTDRNPVSVDESFQLTYEANGSVDDDPDFSPLKKFLDVLNQSESSQISIINGNYKRSKTWTLSVMAKQEGVLTIPPIHFGDDKSQSISIKIVPANTLSTGQNKSFFIELSANNPKAYEQAQVIVTIRVFSDKSLNQIELSSLHFSNDDVISEPLGDETSYQTQINGKAYLVVEKRVALFSQKAGDLSIQPLIASATVNGQSRSLFGNFNQKIVRARSNSLHIKVIPKKTDHAIWLPTQSLSLTQQWSKDPSQFKVGEPITRTITLAAQGLTAAQLPELVKNQPKGVKAYPDQAKLTNANSSVGITGSRQEKIAYIPETAGQLEIPEIQVPWWNVQTHQWQLARLPKQVIKVQANPAWNQQNATQPQLLKPQLAKPDQTPQPIVMPKKAVQEQSTVSNTASTNLNFKSLSVWQWLSIVFALLWLLTLFLWWRKPKATRETVSIAQAIKIEDKFQFKPLKKACSNEDAQLCKNELISWAQSIWSDAGIHNLSGIASRVEDPLKSLIHQLEQNLYSGSKHTNFDFASLYSEVKQFKKNNSKTSQKNGFDNLNLAS